MESGPEIKTWSERLKDLAKVLAVAASVVPAEGIAEEIPEINGQNWYEGGFTLQQSARNAPHEVSALYLISNSGTNQWQSVGEAVAEDKMQTSQADVEKIITSHEQEFGNVELTCMGHTHPHAITRPEEIPVSVLDTLAAEGKYFTPPSPLSQRDLGDVVTTAIGLDEQIVQKPVISTVFTPYGIWYYRPASSDDYAAYPMTEKYFEEQQQAIRVLAGAGDQPGLLHELFSEMGRDEAIAFLDWPSTISDQLVSTEDIVDSVIKNLTTTVYSSDNPLVQKLGTLGEDVNTEVMSVVSMKSIGSFLYRYAYFYSSYGELPEEYNDVVSEFYGSDIADFRQGKKVYYQVKQEDIGGEAIPLTDNLLHNLYEDMLMMGAASRFVTYGQAQSEPPCAGPDYLKQ